MPELTAPAAAGGGQVFDLILRKCRLEGRRELADIAISSGKIAGLADRVNGDGHAELDVGGRLVSCAFCSRISTSTRSARCRCWAATAPGRWPRRSTSSIG